MMLTRPYYFVNNNNADNFNKWLKELEFKKVVFQFKFNGKTDRGISLVALC